MAIQTSRLTQILSGRYRGLIAGLIGLSVGGLFAIACAYSHVAERLSPDAFACLVVFGLFVGWGVAWGVAARSGHQAKKIADILANPGVRIIFDRERNLLVLEQVESVDVGFGTPTETVASRATITFEEAQLIGLEMDASKKRLLLQEARPQARKGSDGPAVELPVETVQSAAVAS